MSGLIISDLVKARLLASVPGGYRMSESLAARSWTSIQKRRVGPSRYFSLTKTIAAKRASLQRVFLYTRCDFGFRLKGCWYIFKGVMSSDQGLHSIFEVVGVEGLQ
jgi:hypothetical protein